MDSRKRAHEFLAKNLDGTELKGSYTEFKAALVAEFDEVRRLALEEAAEIADERRRKFYLLAAHPDSHFEIADGYRNAGTGASSVAEGIRSLMSTGTPKEEK